MESNRKIKSETADQENVRPDQSAQPADTPTDDSAPGMHLHTPFNSPGMHRLAQNRPTPARRPLSEMSDFEKETEIKNAHYVKRLANAQKQLGKSHYRFPDFLTSFHDFDDDG
jgi:23S rRNA G2069 N7-methylase RlmK/C1962 C5-methylase RlmI